jgi:hypothetical protein
MHDAGTSSGQVLTFMALDLLSLLNDVSACTVVVLLLRCAERHLLVAAAAADH